MMRLTVDGMMARGFGRVLNIVSRSVKIPQIELGLSNGARSGLVGFVAGLARQTVGRNVTINNLLPGIFDSDAQRAHVRALVEPGKSFEELWRARGEANPAQALRPAGRARRLLRLPVLRACRFHHRAKSADRRRKLPGDLLNPALERIDHANCDRFRAGPGAHRTAAGHRAGADLSVAHGQRDRAVPGRRLGRRRRPHPGGEAQRDGRPAFHRREPRRRRFRHGRRQCGRQGRARRLHAAALGVDPRHQPVPLQERALRRGERLHAGVAAGRRTADRQHHAERTGEQSQGLLRPGPQGADEIHLRHHQRGVCQPSGDRAAQARRRPRHAGRALQGHGAGAHRPGERADPVAGRSDAVLAAARAGGQDQGARHHQPQAHGRGSQHPDGRRIRRNQGLRVRVLVRPVGAEEPAGRRLRQAVVGPRQGAWRGPRSRSASAPWASTRSARTPAQFAKYVTDEMAKYSKIITDAKIKME